MYATRIRSVVIFLLVTTLLTGILATEAAAESMTVQVYASVRPYLQFSASQSIASYQVTVADLRNGYIDIPRALTIEYQTNIPEALQFNISSTGPERIVIDGGYGVVQVANAPPGQRMARNFDLRILLPTEMETGDYPLQLALDPVAY